jgi:hypothetical protein
MIGSPSPAPGARRQSLLAMHWALINLEKARWVIPDMWSKDGDEMVPLRREACGVGWTMRA